MLSGENDGHSWFLFASAGGEQVDYRRFSGKVDAMRKTVSEVNSDKTGMNFGADKLPQTVYEFPKAPRKANGWIF